MSVLTFPQSCDVAVGLPEDFLQSLTPTMIDKALARSSLCHFIQAMWPVVEKKPFVDGWHVEAMCDHLEAVSRGDIKKLIINIPPRHMKSLAVSVFWPMWDWLWHPERQWLFASYASALSIRDSVKSRRVFQSMGYQDLLAEYQPDLFLTSDQNTKIRFENSVCGYRLATSVDGSLTGEGGDIIVVDDPHNIVNGESKLDRESVISWWDEAMSTRLNDKRNGAYVLIMQRVHQEDLTGHILSREANEWDHLCLPARYEGQCRVKSSLNFMDPRTKQGEALWAERFGEQELASLERSLGAYGTAGQLQQRPAPRGGGMMQVENIKIIDHLDVPNIARSLRYWDKAATEGGTGARSAGVCMHKMKDGSVVIEDVVRGLWSWASREKRILQLAGMDGKKVAVYTEQEPGSGGKESAERTVQELAKKGFSAYKDIVSGKGDKVRRAEPFSIAVENGLVSLLRGEWNKDYLEELELFPNGALKDQTDASSGAYNRLHAGAARAGAWGSGKSTVEDKKEKAA